MTGIASSWAIPQHFLYLKPEPHRQGAVHRRADSGVPANKGPTAVIASDRALLAHRLLTLLWDQAGTSRAIVIPSWLAWPPGR
jgi:hypothetical protein